MALTEEDKQWIAALLDQKLEQVDLKLERVETRLLTAFHQWASPMEGRVRRHRDSIHDLEVELDALNDRLKVLEDRSHGKA